MTYTWVLSNFYAGLVPGAIARVIPRAQIMIENPSYRNGATISPPSTKAGRRR